MGLTCRRSSARISGGHGFTLPELLVVLLLASTVAAGMGGVFATQNRAYLQQDLHVAMAENLRVAMSSLTDTLRAAGCGVPPSDLNSWISWRSGFVDDPVIVTEGGADPDTLSVAACTPPLATMTLRSNAGSTSLTINVTVAGKTISDLFNLTDKSLIWVGDGDYAVIRAVSGTTLTIDTDPTQSGNQGLLRSHPLGTSVSRIDVHTFQIEDDPDDSLPSLRLDTHHGTVTTAAQGITDLQLETLVVGRQYRATLTGRSEREDPISGAFMVRRLVSEITLRN
jgi:prepilin-type N-terminal cleavage/methylation domain-containing protein